MRIKLFWQLALTYLLLPLLVLLLVDFLAGRIVRSDREEVGFAQLEAVLRVAETHLPPSREDWQNWAMQWSRSGARVTVIANAENRGFSKACNQAAAVSSGRHLLLLNSDTVMQPNTLRTMVSCLDRQSDIGVVSCLQRDGQGRVLQSCFVFPSIRDHVRHSEDLPAAIRRWKKPRWSRCRTTSAARK